ncbi:unnamed protein product [Brassica rapa]|uniref:Serine/threonine specific protein phosphatases domain-containing protein n=1 Tax=Brassica campestris TaxID=3711 RepID=A0A3P6BSA2_BRACM|nr:unnamed protein product [Brassica rapa]VDC98648.1 unnamed protein product [Brassica rapa]
MCLGHFATPVVKLFDHLAFAADVVIEFLDKNDLDLICQCHQVVEDKYEFYAKAEISGDITP